MKFVDEFRDPDLARSLVKAVRSAAAGSDRITLMEVCGTHTMSIFRHGIRSLLPGNIRLLSGPGCPVCVTPSSYLDLAVLYAREPDTIITTFGDMMRVPGSETSLEREKALGRDVRVVLSTLDALEIAKNNPGSTVIFLGIGFETTTPTVAASISEAKRLGVANFTVFSAHKLVPPAMDAVMNTDGVDVNGFICPAHVSAIIGTRPYEPIARKYRIPCVVTGFEPLDILQGVLMLARQIRNGEHRVETQYRRVVDQDGNQAATALTETVFEPCDSDWRGIGAIPSSGLAIRERFGEFDITRRLPLIAPEPAPSRGCRCGDILRGLIVPPECPLFGDRCTPENPVGACMVSKGTCAAFYKYGG